MTIEFAIQPVMHGPGYEVVRTADNAVLTTVATAGEASQYIHNLELERRYDAMKDGTLYAKPAQPTGDPLTAIFDFIEADDEPEPQPKVRLAEYAASPEARALYDAMSPEAQQLVDRLIAVIDAIPSEQAEQATNLVLQTLDDLDTFDLASGDELPFGQLADGTPITGVYDAHEPGGRAGIVHAEWNGWRLTADDGGFISFVSHAYRFQSPDVMGFTQLAALRTLLASDCLDQLAQAAIAHGRGDPPPPPAAPASAVTTERFVCDDELDPRGGQEIGTDYCCGETLIYFPDDGGAPALRAFGACITPAMIERDLDCLITLLNDPRVQALREAQRG